MNHSLKRRSDCPVAFSLDLLGDKWTLLILRDMLLFQETHFREFASHEHMATNILSDRLRRLETAGVISSRRDAQRKSQICYKPTNKGWDLLPVITGMVMWGLHHDDDSLASPNFIQRIRDEPTRVSAEIADAALRGKFKHYRGREMGIIT